MKRSISATRLPWFRCRASSRAEGEAPREGGPHAPAARELAEGPMGIPRRESQSTEDDLRLGLQAISPEGFEAMLDVAVALGRFRARRGIGHEGGEALELGL